LVWTALFYAAVGTWLTVKIGRPLVSLNVARQRFEADFRFSLVRFRENAESVALYGGEPVEGRAKGISRVLVDDFVMGFECEEDAQRVYAVLPKRFGTFASLTSASAAYLRTFATS
jgi:ABC-type uncharacterized transport system fused permease/ATPase subunit